MLAMGLTLTPSDFRAVAASPGRVAVGAVLQYTLMPAAGALVCALGDLPLATRVGVTMVSVCPGGVASNAVAFLAKADVPLSVATTAVSTLAASLATPALASLLLGASVPVDGAAMLASTAKVVLAPVALGAVAAAAAPRAVARVAPFAPLVAVAGTVAVCGAVLARSAPSLLASAAVGPTLAAVVALHALGFASGYFASRALGLPERQARTLSIEVGMQNSALGAVLAVAHFPALAGAAAPCAVSACVHSLLGSGLAAWWSQREPRE
jgi:BASS family bile acid:Na+ symporter